MTQDEIIEMALEEWRSGNQVKQAGLDRNYTNLFKAFAKLVAAKEREACANVADKISDKYGYGYYGNEVDTADEIAAAIRARGEA
jgi:hypothetical protein